MATVLNEDKKYPRIRPSIKEKILLDEAGFQWVLSSFISAVGQDGNKLLIRFKNGSVYSYTGVGRLYSKMIAAPSQGKYFWKHIRDKTPYSKGASMPLSNDLIVDDSTLLKDLDTAVKASMFKYVKAPVLKNIVMLKNLTFEKVIVGGLIYYNFL